MIVSDVFQRSPKSRAFYSSLVIEHIVEKSRGTDFALWHDRLKGLASRQQGFVRWDDCPPLPCEDEVVKWYTIIHFDSPQHLKDWVASPARKQLLKEGQRLLRAYRFKSFTTGLEGWFSQAIKGDERRSLGPPAWKQILLVVFGLYPLLMVRLRLLPKTSPMGDWSPSAAMLIDTLVTSTILGLIVMPLLSRLLRFWLYPAYREFQWRTDTLGVAIIGFGFVFMVTLFDYLK